MVMHSGSQLYNPVTHRATPSPWMWPAAMCRGTLAPGCCAASFCPMSCHRIRAS